MGRSKKLHHFAYSYMDYILGMLCVYTIQKGIHEGVRQVLVLVPAVSHLPTRPHQQAGCLALSIFPTSCFCRLHSVLILVYPLVFNPMDIALCQLASSLALALALTHPMSTCITLCMHTWPMSMGTALECIQCTIGCTAPHPTNQRSLPFFLLLFSILSSFLALLSHPSSF